MVTNKKMTSSTYKTFHIGVFFERRTYRGSRIGGKKKKREKNEAIPRKISNESQNHTKMFK